MQWTTDRLALDPLTPDDVDAMFGLLGEVEGWWYEPSGRHVDRERTVAWVTKAVRYWNDDGLSYWVARRSSDGVVVGNGGLQRRADRSWNLAYRISSAHWGHGYAVELARAALTAGAQVDATVPICAWIDEPNVPSRRVAERAGLIARGSAVDANDGAIRLVYSDRPLDAAAESSA